MTDKAVEFGKEVEVHERLEKIAQTGRYDRKAMKARLEIEDWLEEQLIDMFESDDGWELADIDTEEVLDMEPDQRMAALAEKMKDAKKKDMVEPVSKELIEKLVSYAANYSIDSSSRKERPAIPSS